MFERKDARLTQDSERLVTFVHKMLQDVTKDIEIFITYCCAGGSRIALIQTQGYNHIFRYPKRLSIPVMF